MHISMEHVGIIQSVDLETDGLTVITGVNGTGKSTILRSIYAVMKPFSDDEDVYCPDLQLEQSISREFGAVDGFCSSDGSKAKVRVGDTFAVTVDPGGSVSVEGGCPVFPVIACLDFRMVPEPGFPINDHRRGISYLKGLLEILDTIVPGRIVVDDDGETCRYVLSDGSSFPAENISSDERLFLTLKGLLERGTIDKGSILLLDCPEANLHPELQNVLASAVHQLVKIVGANVIMTTCSPQLLMAVEHEFSDIGDVTYLNISREHEVRDVTGNLQPVYAEMSRPILDISSTFLDV